MMDKETYLKFVQLHELFLKECDRIANILKRENKNWTFISKWEFDGDYVYGYGTERWSYGGFNEHELSFPANYLIMSDDELNKMVDANIAKEQKKEEEKNRKKQKEQEEKDLKEYRRLKKIYG